MKKITDYALEEVIVVTRQTIDALLNEEDSAELLRCTLHIVIQRHSENLQRMDLTH